MKCCYTGESGQVYKAYLHTAVGTEIVAVKTVKGIWSVRKLCSSHMQHYMYVHYPYNYASAIYFCFHDFFGDAFCHVCLKNVHRSLSGRYKSICGNGFSH